MEIVQNGRSVNLSLALGPILLAALLNAYFFGIVSQQFFIYWTSGFNDLKRVKIFVVVQFVIVAFESIALWVMIWDIFVASYGVVPQASAWGPFVQLVGQSSLILSANIFLAIRIHSLTKSRLQVGLVIALSTSSFIIGIVNTVTTWDGALASSFNASFSLSPTTNSTAVACYVLRVITECLITTFLSRALLKSRSGIQKSDSVVNYLIRRVIQIGFLAALWTIAGLTTWFFLPKTSAYTLFVATAGPMYTQVIYDTLLSRVQLRKRMAETSNIVVTFSVANSDINGEQRASSLTKRTKDPVSFTVAPQQSLGTDDALVLGGSDGIDDSEVECVSVGLPDARSELSYSPKSSV